MNYIIVAKLMLKILCIKINHVLGHKASLDKYESPLLKFSDAKDNYSTNQ